MRVVVVGAGIVGATTALALAREGFEVSVIEVNPALAMGASFANAGLISPGHCFSWAGPGVVSMATKTLLGLGDGIGLFPPWSPAMARWCALFMREGTPDRWFASSKAALQLAAYSRDLQFVNPPIPAESYGGRQTGILYLYGENNEPGAHDAELLNEAGEPFSVLDQEQFLNHEPLLRDARVKFKMAVYCPRDGTGDAARYAAASLDRAVSLGVKTFFGERVGGFVCDGQAVTAVQTDRHLHSADAVVITAGLSSRCLLAPLGYRLPIHPVTGYSITYKIQSGKLPRVGAVSIPHKVAWAAFGDDTLRFTGYADIGVPGSGRIEGRFGALESFAADVSPELSSLSPSRWVGQRPMTPDSLPFLGASNHANLWLNCGHGAMGWTMANGSAQVIADLVQRRRPAIDLTPFRWNRYGLLRRRQPTE